MISHHLLNHLLDLKGHKAGSVSLGIDPQIFPVVSEMSDFL